MRRSVIAGALLGLVVLTGTPALASPPDIQQKACEADHGTFTRDQGTKTCTTTTVDQTTSLPIPSIYLVGSYAWGELYTGVGTVTAEIATTTTQTQKGNGDVTTTTSMTVLSSSVTEISCTVDQYLGGSVVASSSVARSTCETYGLYPRPLPLGPLA